MEQNKGVDYFSPLKDWERPHLDFRHIVSSLSAPPTEPKEGDIYLVSDKAEGAWAEIPNCLTKWEDGHWLFEEPLDGMTAVTQMGQMYVYNGTTMGWFELKPPEDDRAAIRNLPEVAALLEFRKKYGPCGPYEPMDYIFHAGLAVMRFFERDEK